MSLTLGEKLRQAREAGGITLSEVAEQTRISSLYLESIENDDYRILPGGIFNKGFVKSYAKFVGIDEQEALLDYSRILAETEGAEETATKVYKPEVLTDDGFGSSMIPTIIVAVIILGLMTAGILYGVRYLRQSSEPETANRTAANTNSNTVPASDPGASRPEADIPDMATLRVEFKALTLPVSLSATSDGKMSSNVVTPGTSSIFEPKESLKLSYSRSLAQNVQLTINGKNITLPAVPLVPRRNSIEFDITKENLGQIWTSGSISTDVAPAVIDENAATGTVAAPPTAPPATHPTPVTKPSVEANTAQPPVAKPTVTPKLQPTIIKTPPGPKPAGNKPQ